MEMAQGLFAKIILKMQDEAGQRMREGGSGLSGPGVPDKPHMNLSLPQDGFATAVTRQALKWQGEILPQTNPEGRCQLAPARKPSRAPGSQEVSRVFLYL